VTIRLTPEAEAELTEAYAWYRDRGQSLAKDFLGSFEAVLETLDDQSTAIDTKKSSAFDPCY
jgi:plasmid stabilization system protein ParE